MPRTLPAHLIGADLREIILDAASSLLAEQGFHDFTMAQLAEHVGIAKGTTYLYFPSKESVALAVIERSVERVMAALSTIANGPGFASARLTAMLIGRVILRHRNVAHYDRPKLEELLAVLRTGLHERRARFSGQEIAIFARVIDEGARSGVFVNGDALATATAMFWSTEGLLPSHLSSEDMTPGTVTERVTAVANLLVAGITRRAPSRKASRPVRQRGRLRGLSMLGVPLFCVLLVGATRVSAQTPAVPAFSIARVDSLFARYATPASPGCAVSLDSGSRELVNRAYGMASVELGVPNSPAVVYYGASLAKQFTAAAIVLLEQDGNLRLTDTVRKFIPELDRSTSPITVQQLLEHTSGIRDYGDLLLMSGGHDTDPVGFERAIALLARQRALNFAPGTQFSYSNSGYLLLAEVVKRVSGKPLTDFARERIFEPLGMTGTQFVANHSQLIPGRAEGHRPRGEKWEVSPYLDDTYGDGGLFTTTTDLVKWLRDLATGQVGGKALVDRLGHEAHLLDGVATGFGLGLEVGTFRGHRFLGHGGRSLGAQNYAMTFPAEGVSAVVLCNARDIDAENLARRLAGMVFAPLPRSAAAPARQIDTVGVTVSEADLRAAEGVYFNPLTLALRTVKARDGKLLWTRGDETVMRPTSRTNFRFPNLAGALSFSNIRSGHAQTMAIVPDVGAPTIYVRAEPFVMPARGLAEYTGIYASDEVQATYEVSMSENALAFTAVGSGFSFVAFPVIKDGFRGGDDVLLVFRRNRAGRITGLEFNTSRARNVRFVKTAALDASHKTSIASP